MTFPNDTSSMIRIVHVIDSLGRGGTQTALVNLVKGLSDRNYRQRVYCLNNVVHPDLLKSLTDNGAEVKVIGKLRLAFGAGVAILVYDLLKWKPSLIFTLLFYSDIVGRICAKLARVPVIVSSIRAKNAYKRPWMFYLDRLTARWASKVVFNSKAAIPFAIAHEGVSQEQVVYIPNGVTMAFDSTGHVRRKKREELNISKDTFIIGSIGRLNIQKGFAYLLEAQASVFTKYSNCILLIIGNGSLFGELTALADDLRISDKVRFLGERTDIPELLACMDLYVQPSVFEGMSNATMEALVSGKPVIATAVGGAAELIDDGRTGWLVKPENPTALAEKIIEVLDNRQLQQLIGTAAAERMRDEFSVDKMVESYDALFRRLIAGKEESGNDRSI